MSSPNPPAVFLSYASQDAAAARRICEALRTAGVEVWFDQNELVGGDAWDAKIRKQIAECALFVPVISAATQARLEGYFRIEWKLAARRTHAMATARAFLLPVVIDGTRDADAHVPDEFREVQWTRLPGGEAADKFCARVGKLLEVGVPAGGAPAVGASPASPSASVPKKTNWLGYGAMAAVAAVALVFAARWYWWRERPRSEKPAAAVTAAPPTEAQRLIRQARALMDDDPLAVRENFLTAYELAERATGMAPDDGEAWATLARVNYVLHRNYGMRDDRQLAALRSQVERAIRLAPQSVEAGLAKAQYEFRIDENLPATRARLEALVDRFPSDRRLYRALAGLRQDREEDLPEVRRWVEQANRLPGGDAEALVHLAWLEWGLNRLAECQATLDRSFAVGPCADAHHLQLMLLNVRGDFAGASAHLARIPGPILREDRVAIIVYELFTFQGQHERALKTIAGVPREILHEGRFFAVRGLLAGRALLALGRTQAAALEFQAALRAIDARLALEPRESRLHDARASVLVHLGDREAATRHFETAREIEQNSSRGLEQLVLLGRIDDAVAFLDRELDRGRSRWPSLLRRVRSDPLFAGLREELRVREIISRGERWLQEVTAPVSAASKADDKSVAVLAFANLSDDKANEYFSDGISEELLNVLAKVPGLKVTARTSAFSFKGKNVPVPEIARQLGVAYVVEGSVRKAGEKVRITAQLIKAADGFHVWSENFNRDLKDIFAVQDEIAGLVARQLSLQLGTRGAGAAAPMNPQAFEHYVQAVQSFNLRTKAGAERAEALLQRVIGLEPNFARAHALRAANWAVSVEFTEPDAWSYGWRNSPGLREMQQVARRAIELEPECAEAHAALGILLPVWQNEMALVALRRAVELNPNYASAHHWLGYALLYDGRMDEALQELNRAVELDPLSHRIRDLLGRTNHLAGRYSAGLAAARQALKLQPDSGQANLEMGVALVDLAQREEGLTYLMRSVELQPYQIVRVMHALVRAGRLDLIEQLARSPAAQANSQFEFTYHLARGGLDAAFGARALDRMTAFEELLFDPFYEPVRHDPRFVAIMKALNLTAAQARAQAWRATHPPEKPGAKP